MEEILLEAMALLAIGYRSLSLSGPFSGSLKKMILSLPLKKAEDFMTSALKKYSPSLREELLLFVREHEVMV